MEHADNFHVEVGSGYRHTPNDLGAALSHQFPAAVNVADVPKFLNAIEVAERLRVSRSTVYNLIASGRLAAHRNGGGEIRPRGVRIAEAAVEAFLSDSLISPPGDKVAA
ncbi:helix-turn-helix domain-containing protein [Streptomyces stramineus]|uniref:Helix-turn-helix domain-containing protein n=1 Tax=Streptomyces stramineus TaxID=173861 RepID=A0ABP3JHQ1_9ACTN